MKFLFPKCLFGQGESGKSNVRTIKEIKKQLLEEIESLKDERGLIQAGFPRYSRFFGRDSLIASWQLLSIQPDICRQTLKILAFLQGKKIDKKSEEEPGKIIHETHWKLKWNPNLPGAPFPYYASVDSTPLFLIIFYLYFKKTKDREFLKKYWKNISAALNWMEEYGDFDNDLFLEYQRKNPRGLFHQGWKDSTKNVFKIKPPVTIVEAQGYQYLALKEGSKMAMILGKNNLSKKVFKRAERLKKAFNKIFWMTKEKYFALALDGKKNAKKTITSNPGHLLFTGILAKEREKQVVKRIFQKDLWTPFGIRTHSSNESDFDPLSYHKGSVWPHDNWIIAQGLKKLGYKKEYAKIKTAIIAAYQEIGFIPELYGVVDNKITLKMKERVCYPQAWSSGALLNFLSSKF